MSFTTVLLPTSAFFMCDANTNDPCLPFPPVPSHSARRPSSFALLPACGEVLDEVCCPQAACGVLQAMQHLGDEQVQTILLQGGVGAHTTGQEGERGSRNRGTAIQLGMSNDIKRLAYHAAAPSMLPTQCDV